MILSLMDRIVSSESRLAALRRTRGWSQATLAERAGVSRPEISAIETGRLVPSVAVALGIAAAFGEPVETVFGSREPAPAEWAWRPASDTDGRAWQASVGGQTRLYPVESTAAGVLPHDIRGSGTTTALRGGAGAPEQTLVIAGCDPLVSLLSRELAADGIRLLPLLRSSTEALDLLQRGLVHVAGVHFSSTTGRSTNDHVVRARLGPGFRLLHQVRWETGIAVVGSRRERTPEALLRAGVRWVNREEGSAARQAFDALLASRRRPEGYDHVVRDHRAVATTVASGWAEAGVCVRPAAAEAHLPFISLHGEAYELCVPDAALGDPRIEALMRALRARRYREQVADVPGCDARHTGDVRAVA